MADVLIISVMLVPVLILFLSMCTSCWKERKVSSALYLFNKKYYLKPANFMELAIKDNENKCVLINSDNVNKIPVEVELLDSADATKQFEHAVLEIDQFDPKIEQDIEVLSCKSNDSGNTYYSIYPNRRVSCISTHTLYLDLH